MMKPPPEIEGSTLLRASGSTWTGACRGIKSVLVLLLLDVQRFPKQLFGLEELDRMVDGHADGADRASFA